MFEILSDFKIEKEVDGDIFASVACRSPSQLWLKKNRRIVFLGYHEMFWAFVDTGRRTPGFEIENMYRKHLSDIKAKKAGLIKE